MGSKSKLSRGFKLCTPVLLICMFVMISELDPGLGSVRVNLYAQDEPADDNQADDSVEIRVTRNKFGTVITETQYVRGEKHGWERVYDPKKFYGRDRGCLVAERNYRNGVPHGIWREYYPNGSKLKPSSLKSVVSYSDGKRDGVEVLYDREGFVTEVEAWRNGLFDGYYQSWYSETRLQSISTPYWKDGTRFDLSRSYRRNGDPRMGGWWVNGERFGVWESYDFFGNVTKTDYGLYQPD